MTSSEARNNFLNIILTSNTTCANNRLINYASRSRLGEISCLLSEARCNYSERHDIYRMPCKTILSKEIYIALICISEADSISLLFYITSSYVYN